MTPYDITLSDLDNAIRVDVSGDRSIEESVRLWTLVGEESAARKQHRILAIMRMKGRLSTTQMYSLASNYARYNLTPAHRIAVVDGDVETLPDNQFASLVASNRGLRLAAFTDEKEALDWLLSE